MKKRELGKGIPLAQIATHLGLKLAGDGQRPILGISALEYGFADCIAFSNDKSSRRVSRALEGSPLAALIVDASVNLSELPSGFLYLQSPDPLRSFIDLVPLFFEPYPTSHVISKLASVHPSCKLGKDVSIGDFVSIGEGCVIGDNVTIHPNVTIYPEVVIGKNSVIQAQAVIRERCILGDGVIIQPGAVIGSDGFGYIPDPKEGIRAVPQVGIAHLASRVEVGANTCVDRGAFGNTVIGQGTKLDNFGQIGHNARIGNYSIVCAHTSLAGSSELGNQVTIGGNSAIANRVKISDKIRVAGQSAATHDLTEPGDYAGFPSVPAGSWRREMVALHSLPDLLKKLKKLVAAEDLSETEEK